MTTETQAELQERLAAALADREHLTVERDQYASTSRHLACRIREVAYTWSTTLPETVRTADVVTALLGIASRVPDRPDLRDDLWQRIVGAYEARFENDGHPEDARAAADEAKSIVQPESDRLRDDRDCLAAQVARVQVVCTRLAPSVPGSADVAVAHSRGWNDALDAVQTELARERS